MFRVLLDEQLDVDLRFYFDGDFDVVTVRYRGWSGLENGELLKMAAQEFEAFVTKDTNIPHQQNLINFPLRVIIIKAKSNDLADILPAMPAVNRALRELAVSECCIIKAY